MGTGACLAITRILGRAATGDGWRAWTIFAAVLLLYAAILALMLPIGDRAAQASAPLALSAVFALWGIFYSGARYVVVGLVVAALTLVGFFTIHEYFLLWNGAVLGGSLLFAGLWMRRV